MVSGEELAQQFHSCMPLFIALGDEVRLGIIEALSRTAKDGRTGGLNVNEITRCTRLSRPAISHHLKILKDAGLVESERSGTANYYRLTLADSTLQLMEFGAMVQEYLSDI